ncbi:hypothetical protein [Streptomyces uncialis]|uniref:hypothetical protein n=1 Tax=Streptomyces uncialis TaxID=1048205 RepID=UPI002256FA16|nr:hypothetical protein [Streptomyces uncialis]MCX4661508.1 hypothetical protein [Streptomyces uncialis]
MDLGYALLPVPGGGQAPAVPGDLAALALALDPHLVQHCVDQADRDARYSTAPLHTVVTAETGALWIKTSAVTSTWATVWEPTPAWRPVVPAAGISQSGETPMSVRRIGNHIYLQGRCDRADGLNITGEPVNVGRVPADCVPVDLRTYSAACSLGGTTIQAAGRMEVLGTTSSSPSGTAGDLLWWYQGEGGAPWVDVSGNYWKS